MKNKWWFSGQNKTKQTQGIGGSRLILNIPQIISFFLNILKKMNDIKIKWDGYPVNSDNMNIL